MSNILIVDLVLAATAIAIDSAHHYFVDVIPREIMLNLQSTPM